MLRSLFVSLLFIFAISFAGRYPWAAPLTFLWVSVMNPHKLSYGFAASVPYALLAAGLTIIVVILSKKRAAIPLRPFTWFYLALLIWMSLSTYLSINTPDEVVNQWVTVLKIHLMVAATALLVFERKSVDAMIWVIVLSLAFFGIKGGIFTVITGGQFLVWGPPSSVVEGNNELGLALVMIIPLTFYLYSQAQTFAIRFGLVFSVFFCMVAVLGTHSRGALVALVSMALVLGVWSKQAFRNVFLIAVVVGIAVLLMPDSWTSRMETISEYQSDQSAMSRINTWSMIWELAKDRPFFGAGFRLDNIDLYMRYLPGGAASGFGPHSIYFQAAGEHGFVGLFLYLSLFLFAWLNFYVVRTAFEKSIEMRWAATLAKMSQVSLVGFLTGGAFLGIMHWDIPYYLLALSLILRRFVVESEANLGNRDRSQYAPRWSRHFD
jgi:putative inorganic carbon (hco3(-)) transporter